VAHNFQKLWHNLVIHRSYHSLLQVTPQMGVAVRSESFSLILKHQSSLSKKLIPYGVGYTANRTVCYTRDNVKCMTQL